MPSEGDVLAQARPNLSARAIAVLVTAGSAAKQAVADLDWAVSSVLVRLESRAVWIVMRIFTALGSPKAFIPVGLGSAGWSWWKGSPRAALVLAAVTLVTREFIRVTKGSLRRVRPDFPSKAQTLRSSSFPSGHTLAGVAVYGTVARVVVQLEPGIQPAAIVVAPLVMLMIGVSRVALGAHWMTDVLAGFLLGAVIFGLGNIALGG
jgi:membrane-associated phospholipid phosphatase